MRLFIIRHAETIENKSGICQGQLPGNLSDKGHEEAELLAKRLEGVQIDQCYTSDLTRAYDTCEHIVGRHATLSVQLDERLRERFFGSMQGKPFPEHESLYPPETESVLDITIRLESLLREVVTLYGSTAQTVLFVSHGFTIRVLVAMLRGLPLENVWEVPEILNTSITVFDYTDKDGWIEEMFNDDSHTRV